MSRQQGSATVLRFDLDGRDALLWSARAPFFFLALRGLVGESRVHGGHVVRQILNRLPMRGVDFTGARPRSSRAVDIEEAIVRTYRAREAAIVATREANAAFDAPRCDAGVRQLGEELTGHHAVVVGEHGRDLLIGGDAVTTLCDPAGD